MRTCAHLAIDGFVVFLRLRVVAERLLALFELERRLLLALLPLDRAEPRFEPRLVCRVLRFEPLAPL